MEKILLSAWSVDHFFGISQRCPESRGIFTKKTSKIKKLDCNWLVDQRRPLATLKALKASFGMKIVEKGVNEENWGKLREFGV